MWEENEEKKEDNIYLKQNNNCFNILFGTSYLALLESRGKWSERRIITNTPTLVLPCLTLSTLRFVGNIHKIMTLDKLTVADRSLNSELKQDLGIQCRSLEFKFVIFEDKCD